MATSFNSRLSTAPEEGCKAPCVTVSLTNITLSGEQTIGVTAVESGDRVLVAGQTDSAENGIWVCNTSSWTRAKDWNTAEDVAPGMLIPVSATEELYQTKPFTGAYNPGVTEITFGVGILSARSVETQTGSQAVSGLFTLTTTTYTPGANNLEVDHNGQRLNITTDYTEPSASTVQIVTARVINPDDIFTFRTNSTVSNSVTTTSAVSHTSGGVTYNLATYLRGGAENAVNLRAVGASGDGVTYDGAEFTNACTLAMGGTLFVPAGSYNLAGLGSRITLTGNLTIIGEGDNSIITLSAGLFEIANYDLIIKDVKFVNGLRAIRAHSTTTTGNNRIVLDNVTVSGGTTFVQIYDEATADLREVLLDGVSVDGTTNFIVYENDAPSVDNTIVRGCKFVNCYREILLFTNRTNSVGSYEIYGNYFKDLNNTVVSGTDIDCHFIRCAGEKATIVGNVFHTLKLVSSSAITDDSETIRPHCDQLIVANNVFYDCFFEEACVAVKSSYDVTITGNLFYISDAFRALWPAKTHNGVVTAGHSTRISNNVFRGINGTILDVSGAEIDDSITFSGNVIEDCTSAKLFDFNSTMGSVFLRNNQVVGITYPASIIDLEFGGNTSSVIELTNNNFRFATAFSTGVINRNGISLKMNGNDIEASSETTALISVNAATNLTLLESIGNRVKNVNGLVATTTAFTLGNATIDDYYEMSLTSANTATKTLFGLDIPNGKNIRKTMEMVATSSSGGGFLVVDRMYSSNGSALSQIGSDIVNATSALASVTLTDTSSANDTTTTYRNQSANTVRFKMRLKVNVS